MRVPSRGVRRVFAVDVPHVRVFEWSSRVGDWELMPDAGAIDDPCFIRPLPVAALVKAARVDDAMAAVLLAKRNPVLIEAIAQSPRAGGVEHGARGFFGLVFVGGAAPTPGGASMAAHMRRRFDLDRTGARPPELMVLDRSNTTAGNVRVAQAMAVVVEREQLRRFALSRRRTAEQGEDPCLARGHRAGARRVGPEIRSPSEVAVHGPGLDRPPHTRLRKIRDGPGHMLGRWGVGIHDFDRGGHEQGMPRAAANGVDPLTGQPVQYTDRARPRGTLVERIEAKQLAVCVVDGRWFRQNEQGAADNEQRGDGAETRGGSPRIDDVQGCVDLQGNGVPEPLALRVFARIEAADEDTVLVVTPIELPELSDPRMNPIAALPDGGAVAVGDDRGRVFAVRVVANGEVVWTSACSTDGLGALPIEELESGIRHQGPDQGLVVRLMR